MQKFLLFLFTMVAMTTVYAVDTNTGPAEAYMIGFQPLPPQQQGTRVFDEALRKALLMRIEWIAEIKANKSELSSISDPNEFADRLFALAEKVENAGQRRMVYIDIELLSGLGLITQDRKNKVEELKPTVPMPVFEPKPRPLGTPIVPMPPHFRPWKPGTPSPFIRPKPAPVPAPALVADKITVEAGPIWNHADANTKCYKVCEKAGRSWTGGWWTTKPGVMSVCECQK